MRHGRVIGRPAGRAVRRAPRVGPAACLAAALPSLAAFLWRLRAFKLAAEPAEHQGAVLPVLPAGSGLGHQPPARGPAMSASAPGGRGRATLALPHRVLAGGL